MNPVICYILAVFRSLRCIDGCITCGFTSFLTVFQSYQDDGRLMMLGCVQWNSVHAEEDFTSSEA